MTVKLKSATGQWEDFFARHHVTCSDEVHQDMSNNGKYVIKSIKGI